MWWLSISISFLWNSNLCHIFASGQKSQQWGFIPSHQYLCSNLSVNGSGGESCEAFWHSDICRYVLLNPTKTEMYSMYIIYIYLYSHLFIYVPLYLYIWDYTWDAHYIKILCAHIHNICIKHESMKQTLSTPRLDATVDQQITEWCLPENRHDFFISPSLIHMLVGGRCL